MLLHGPFPVEDMDRPLSSWGYGMAPFQLGTLTRAPKGVQRRLGIKGLLVFGNILTILFKKFAGLTG